MHQLKPISHSFQGSHIDLINQAIGSVNIDLSILVRQWRPALIPILRIVPKTVTATSCPLVLSLSRYPERDQYNEHNQHQLCA